MQRPSTPSVFLALYYVGIMAVGVAGFLEPSPTINRALGLGYVAYSTGVIGFAVLALAAVVLGAPRAESSALVAIAFLTVLHGLALWAEGQGNSGMQTGIRLLAALPGALALSWYRRQTIYTRNDLARETATRERGSV